MSKQCFVLCFWKFAWIVYIAVSWPQYGWFWLCAFKNGFIQVRGKTAWDTQYRKKPAIGSFLDQFDRSTCKWPSPVIASKKEHWEHCCMDQETKWEKSVLWQVYVSCITNHKHFKAISLILDTCQKLLCLIAINRSYVYPSDKKSAHR